MVSSVSLSGDASVIVDDIGAAVVAIDLGPDRALATRSGPGMIGKSHWHERVADEKERTR